MEHKPIQHALQPHFNLDPRRLEFIARFLIALLKVRTVNLNLIATALNGHALLESNAKLAKRFLEFKLDQHLIAKFALAFIGDKKIVPCMDRTTWKFGRVTINLLVVGVAHNGIALPIAWVNLRKDSNSNASEHAGTYSSRFSNWFQLRAFWASRRIASSSARRGSQVCSNTG
jgi:hypothetical protein